MVALPSQAQPAPPPGHMAIQFKQVLTPNIPDITVVSPEDEHLKYVIDTMALNVLEGGCAFEQAIMERVRGSPLFNFLFELGSKEHTYYVWRLYSLAQGDTLQSWRTELYIMIAGCGRWIPPPLPATRTQSMVKSLHEKFLENVQVVEVLKESLTLKETSIPTKVTRLMLVPYILHNSSAPVKNPSACRTKLRDIMENFNDLYCTETEIGNNMIWTRTTNEEQRAQVMRETIMIEAKNKTEIGADEA